MISTKGILRYKIGDGRYGGYKLSVEDLDPEISKFYLSLIPKSNIVQPQAFPTHCTVVRYEVPPNLEAWGLYEGEEIELLYDPYIFSGTIYWWLNCYSKRLEQIRAELGFALPALHPADWSIPEPEFEQCFHITIGNSKSKA